MLFFSSTLTQQLLLSAALRDSRSYLGRIIFASYPTPPYIYSADQQHGGLAPTIETKEILIINSQVAKKMFQATYKNRFLARLPADLGKRLL
jgi:hypothetical protein